MKRARAAVLLPCTAFLSPLPVRLSHHSPHLRCSFSSPYPRLRTISHPAVHPVTPITRCQPKAISDSTLPQNLTDVPEPLLKAVESLSRQPRQTIPDIAAASGLPLNTAQIEAAKLAALVAAPIDVTDAGDLAYRFPRDVRAALRSRSFRASLRMALRTILPPLFAIGRAAFGALLFLSIIITFVAIAAISSSSSSDDDRNNSRSSFMPTRIFTPNIFDLIWYTGSRPTYTRAPNTEMPFLEAVYSFVFGDGDPNENLDARRYRAIAATIRSNGGAVTADQLAPFLDPSSEISSVVDESFVLPVVQRFQGRPEVTDDGDIIYIFPDFMRTGTSGTSFESVGSPTPLTEAEISLTRATSGQRAMVVGLGFVNVLGVLALGAQLVSTVPLSSDTAALLALVKSVYPALAAYAASFVFIPLARWYRLRRINEGVRKRNRARILAARRLMASNVDVRRKLLAARRYAQEKGIVTSDNVVYSTDIDLIDQQDALQDDFDRRLKG